MGKETAIALAKLGYNVGITYRSDATYENALASGDKNVYFIPGYELMEFAGEEGSVDLCHPTDLGFTSMAKRLSVEFKKILK